MEKTFIFTTIKSFAGITTDLRRKKTKPTKIRRNKPPLDESNLLKYTGRADLQQINNNREKLNLNDLQVVSVQTNAPKYFTSEADPQRYLI